MGRAQGQRGAGKLILEEAQRALARMRPLSPASRFDVGFMA